MTHRSPVNLFRYTAAAVLLCAAPVPAAVLQLDIVTVGICDSGPAGCFEPDIDQSYMNRIFDQADISLNFLPSPDPVTLDLASLSNSAGRASPFSLLTDFANTAAPDTPPGVAVLGFGPRLTGNTVGAAFFDAPSFPFGIVSADGTSRPLQSVVAAHELGHILGADHTDDGMGALMDPVINVSLLDDPGFLPFIPAGVAGSLRSSSLLQELNGEDPGDGPGDVPGDTPEILPPSVAAVPLPPAFAGFLMALSAFAFPALRRRRRAV
ncbi:hypothetical protein [uncultured Roseobacter sp.]|uniref:hypothetical protein n=1 Tax=uncultured Roseobacter sp. TaxID=114847 RepID=UPI002631D4A9|nr:hypothetical protein [uncultured Roseobacter sp.]